MFFLCNILEKLSILMDGWNFTGSNSSGRILLICKITARKMSSVTDKKSCSKTSIQDYYCSIFFFLHYHLKSIDNSEIPGLGSDLAPIDVHDKNTVLESPLLFKVSTIVHFLLLGIYALIYVCRVILNSGKLGQVHQWYKWPSTSER